MKKENYAYLVLGIAMLVLWFLDMKSFFKLSELYEFARAGYALLGLPLSLLILTCAFSTDEIKETRKICSICGDNIMKNEKSIHYPPKDGDTIDYCEKCTGKILK